MNQVPLQALSFAKSTLKLFCPTPSSAKPLVFPPGTCIVDYLHRTCVRDTAVNKTKQICPQGAYILIGELVRFNILRSYYECGMTVALYLHYLNLYHNPLM